MASPQQITDPATLGWVRVLGGPGTGKTSLLVDAAAARIVAGAHPESVLLLCPTSRAAVRTRRALARTLTSHGAGPVIREPLVRTVHSYAFGVLRLAAQRAGEPPPRLVTGTEQDGIIRELLAGDLADGERAAVGWPEPLRPALATAGFATQLRDLLARCAERGVDGPQLQRAGRLHGRPEWVAAGQFAQQYEQVMLLRAAAGRAAPQATVPALGAAELIGAALDAFATDPGLLDAERDRIRVLLVDDAQHLDPQAAQLVAAIAGGAAVTVIAGDPNQTVFGFRGAQPRLLVADGDQVVTLSKSHRCAPAIARAVSAVAARLPGVDPGRVIEGSGDSPGSLAVRLASSEHAEAALIADALRRAHLIDGVPWPQMAVIVRSIPRAAAVLPRALSAAGVPVRVPAPAIPPVQHPAVHALLTALAAAADKLTAEQALTLVTGPIGRIDPVSLRGLRRGLRRRDTSSTDFGTLLVEALTGGTPSEPALAGPQVAALRRVRAVLDAAARVAGDDPRFALWQAWSRSGLQRRWLRARARGGSAGAQADRDLDAVTTLFDIAADYAACTPGATVRGFVDHVSGLTLQPPEREPLIEPDAVAVVSAHAAVGREWDFVVIAGLQEGLWPNTIPRGGVLRTQELVDFLDGVDTPVSRVAPVLADERRLLVAALGRARRRVLVTAVDSDTDDAAVPSAFVDELARWADDTAGREPATAPRTLTPSALVGRLRAVVCAPEDAVNANRSRCAATQLARLAAAGVPGADPAGWYGMSSVSTHEPLSHGAPVTLSPSTLQTLADCPLRWLLERHGGTERRDLRSTLGSLVHALVAADGGTEAQQRDRLEKVWNALPFEANWYSRNELARHQAMLSAFYQWRAQTRQHLTEVATEVDVDGVLTSPQPDLPDVKVRGRIDRLERDGEGRLVVVDIKTGRTPATKDDAQSHAQLAMYQLAIAAGLLPGDEPGGGRLVYLGKPGIVERDQDALTPDSAGQWQQTVHQAAAATGGPEFVARINSSCAHCPVRSSCPAWEARR